MTNEIEPLGIEDLETEDLVDAIVAWDKVDIDDLRDMLEELENRHESNQINMSSLPSAEEFEERVMVVAMYPVWACDTSGWCLCGPAADETKPLNKIEEEWGERE